MGTMVIGGGAGAAPVDQGRVDQGWVDQVRVAWVRPVMGMPVSIHVRGRAARGAEMAGAVAAAYAELRRLDGLLSPFRAESEVSRFDRGELAAADAGPELREVLDLCALAWRRTGGFFDPWLPRPDGSRRFDPCGLVKGWAVERALSLVVAVGGHDVLVDAGGDVATYCVSGRPWRVGVEDPADRSRLLRLFEVGTGAVATSGLAARGAHVLDPHTGRPATALSSVTVVGPSLTWADVDATAALARGTDAARWLATRPDVHDALVVAA